MSWLHYVPMAAHPVFQTVMVLTVPWSSVASVNPILVWFKIHLLFYHCLFFNFCLDEYSLWITHFWKMLSGFITGRDSEATRLHALLSVHELTEAQGPVAHRLWKKGCDWSWITIHICYLGSDLWTEELVVKFVSSYNHSWLYAIVSDSWTLLGGALLFT